MIQTLTYASSLAALPSLKSGSVPWSKSLKDQAADLTARVAGIDHELLQRAVETEVTKRVANFAGGVARYQAAPIPERTDDWQTVWQEGTTCLKRLSGEGMPILLVPSLINRAYVLDFLPGQSLAEYLRATGYQVYLLDWDSPGQEERAFEFSNYVARVVRAIDIIAGQHQDPVRLLGYCMGGLLALAGYLQQKEAVSHLILLATPWDFSKMPKATRAALGALLPTIDLASRHAGEVSVDMLQAMFFSDDPLLVLRKFRAFQDYPPGSKRAQQFVALQDWLNDGVPLARGVALSCLKEWYLENRTVNGQWACDGERVLASDVTCPTLIVVPDGDTVVPPASAAALAEQISDADKLEVKAGHIGMVAGPRARAQLYEPLTSWLDCHETAC